MGTLVLPPRRQAEAPSRLCVSARKSAVPILHSDLYSAIHNRVPWRGCPDFWVPPSSAALCASVVKAVLADLAFWPSTGENMPRHFPISSPFPAREQEF